jgi:hypothetical protein
MRRSLVSSNGETILHHYTTLRSSHVCSRLLTSAPFCSYLYTRHEHFQVNYEITWAMFKAMGQRHHVIMFPGYRLQVNV